MDPTDDKDEPCEKEYLEITDGSYGYQKFCGKTDRSYKWPEVPGLLYHLKIS